MPESNRLANQREDKLRDQISETSWSCRQVIVDLLVVAGWSSLDFYVTNESQVNAANELSWTTTTYYHSPGSRIETGPWGHIVSTLLTKSGTRCSVGKYKCIHIHPLPFNLPQFLPRQLCAVLLRTLWLEPGCRRRNAGDRLHPLHPTLPTAWFSRLSTAHGFVMVWGYCPLFKVHTLLLLLLPLLLGGLSVLECAVSPWSIETRQDWAGLGWAGLG